MTRHERKTSAGYAVVLIGAVGFLVGCFLPYVVPQGSPSIWELSSTSASDTFGTVMNLFPGPALLIAIAVLGIRAPRGWFVPTLIAVTIVWSLARIGGLVFTYDIWDVEMGIGFWLMATGVVVVIVGTVVVVVSFLREGPPAELDDAGSVSSSEPVG